ncbi:T9SS type A sorting domain-containing protein [Phaeocystidibacter luteus]|uniref:T9SS type A sorting domain-containing protein n=1 Tax=Phaeocystidibacter luteus TaxID=911197 RepID=A0A6N6RM77_9FLAO|nr:T9SS type A sorting domain-containing protein [Phaeocystidibacter luteus]KAB2814673.1 T9SS type A sorting domain-containing protein [Phaeocystidibacter luteus]
MKKSHTFTIRGVVTALALAITPFLIKAQDAGTRVDYNLYPESSSTIDAEVTGTFEMNFTWTGSPSKIHNINWDNSASNSANGSAYLKIYDAEGTMLWSGYPNELTASTHAFEAVGVILETGHSYRLSFDLSQVDVSLYSNSSFPWNPNGNGPIEINSTELTGMIDNPVDPDLIFPYFTVNMEYGVSIDEELLENWSPSPNPATSFITLPELTEEYEVRLMNIAGQTVADLEVAENTQTRLNVSDLPAGVYMLQILSNGASIATERVIVE